MAYSPAAAIRTTITRKFTYANYGRPRLDGAL
jgi:hypothetical protein